MSEAHSLDTRPFLVPPGKKIRLEDYDPGYTAGFPNKIAAKEALLQDVTELALAQDVFWASKEYALVIVFQALDAAGKDGTVKHVMSGVNPQGVSVNSFKAPSEEERHHHFLWRPMQKLPANGMISIFNRSYYEEVLVVRVHPEFLKTQVLPRKLREADLKHIWTTRYAEINEFERSLTEQNTLFLKFFLHSSKEEQRKRFLKRLQDPQKHWKFSIKDIQERAFWDDYQVAYEEMLNATSTAAAPWYIIPADKKWFTRACVADIITARMRSLNLEYPVPREEDQKQLEEARRQLAAGAEPAA